MSATVTGKIDPGTKHDQAMEILNRAIVGTREMIQKRMTPPAFSRFSRGLSDEELKKLPQSLDLLEKAAVFATNQKLEDIPLGMVCGSKALLSHFKRVRLRTVMDMWQMTPNVLVGLLEQGEALGAKNELHMYLFVRR